MGSLRRKKAQKKSRCGRMNRRRVLRWFIILGWLFFSFSFWISVAFRNWNCINSFHASSSSFILFSRRYACHLSTYFNIDSSTRRMIGFVRFFWGMLLNDYVITSIRNSIHFIIKIMNTKTNDMVNSMLIHSYGIHKKFRFIIISIENFPKAHKKSSGIQSI